MKPLLLAFGARVRQLRQQRDWSLQQLADRAAVSRRFLVEIEAGRANPSLEKVAALAQAFRLDLPTLCQMAPVQPLRRIALIGLRGAGKTALGRALAERLEQPFTELDEWIQEHAGRTSAEIFAHEGVTGFRRREEEALEAWLARTAEGVLAVAGGLADNPAAWTRLHQSCLVIWLRADPQAHWDRVVAQGDERPMRGVDDARARLERLWHERAPVYARAHHVVDTTQRSEAACLEELLRICAAPESGRISGASASRTRPTPSAERSAGPEGASPPARG